jgi:hypothetical protein
MGVESTLAPFVRQADLCSVALDADVRFCRWERDQMSRICARACPSGGRAGPCAVRLGSARC